jgi:hypothetical protein
VIRRVAICTVLALALAGAPLLAHAQFANKAGNVVGTIGGTCNSSFNDYGWPDTNGNILKCVANIWTLVTLPAGAAGSTGYVQFNSGGALAGSANLFWNNSSSYLGIGTATPESELEVYGGEVQIGSSGASCSSINAGALRYASSALYFCNGSTWTSSATGGTASAAGSTGQVQFNSSGSLGANANFFWDNTNYRLGIGTSVPLNRLDVSGRVAIGSGYAGVVTAPYNGLLVKGNVGIGTTAPYEPLNVVATLNSDTAGDVQFYNANDAATENINPGAFVQVTATKQAMSNGSTEGIMGWADDPSSNTNTVVYTEGVQGLATIESTVSTNWGGMGLDGEAFLSGNLSQGDALLIGVNGYAEQDTGSINYGGVVGANFEGVVVGGTVSNGVDGAEIFAANEGGTVTGGMDGIYVESDINGGTVDYRIGLYLAQGAGSPSGTAPSDFGVYQESGSAVNYFAGQTGIGGQPSSYNELAVVATNLTGGSPSAATASLIYENSNTSFGFAAGANNYAENDDTEAETNDTIYGSMNGAENNAYINESVVGVNAWADNAAAGSENASGDEGNPFGIFGGFFQATNEGTVEGTIEGISVESYNGGTATNNNGMDGINVQTGTYGTATLTGGMDGIYVEPDIWDTSSVDYRVGIFIAAGAGSPSTSNNDWGIYQESTSAANYFGGNVGIGTTIPNIAGWTSASVVQTIEGSNASGVLEVSNGAADANGVQIGAVDFVFPASSSGDRELAQINAVTSGTTSGNRGSYLRFYTKGDGGSLTERMRIDNSDNVGIGTATPESKLEIYSGEVQIGSSGASGAAVNAGALRYSGGTFYYCNGSAWTSSGSGGSSVNFTAPASKNIGTIYQAGTAGIVTAYITRTTSTCTLTGLIGTSTPPGTTIVEAASPTSNLTVAIAFPVVNGDYYEVTENSGTDCTTPSGEYFTALSGSGSGGTPGGSSTDVQFNSSGALAGDSGFTYAGSGGNVTISGSVGIGTTAPDATLNLATSMSVSGAGVAFEYDNSGVVRNQLYPGGSQVWWLNSGSSEVGQIQFSTPSNLPGMAFENSSGTGRSQIGLSASGGGLGFAAETGNGALASTQMVLSTSGNLGIGTTTPQVKLDVQGGNLAVNSGTALNTYPSVLMLGGNTVAAYDAFEATSNSLLTINKAGWSNVEIVGNVGIGTTAPGSPLEVDAQNNTNGIELRNDSLGSRRSWLLYPVTNGSNTDMKLYEYSGSSGDRVTFQSGGNVGIGTTNPTEILEVSTSTTAAAPQFQIQSTATGGSSWYLGATDNGNAIGGGKFMINNAGTSAGSLFVINSSGNVGIGTTAPESLLEVYGGEVQIGSSGASCAAVNAGALRYASGSLYYCNGSTWTAPSGGGSSGTVNIGTQYQMAYYATTGSAVSGDANITTDSSSDLIVGSGKVGIGTAGLNSTLDIYSNNNAVGATNSGAQLLLEGNSNNVGLQMTDDQSGGRTWAVASSGGSAGTPDSFRIVDMSASGGTDRLVINSSGNVGIGTTTPSGKIESDGGASTWAGFFNYNSGAPSGAYGIWTYGSSYSIDANGPAYFTSNVYIGGALEQNQGAYIYPGCDGSCGNNQGSYYLNADTNIAGIMTNSNFYASGNIYLGAWGNWLTTILSSYLNAATNTYSNYVYGCAPGSYGGNGLYQSGETAYLDWYSVYTCATAAASDARMKTDIEALSDEAGLANLMKLKPVTFKWKDPKRAALEGEQSGFIAQDVEKVYPQSVRSAPGSAVIIEADGSKATIEHPRSLKYMDLIAPLVKAVQELKIGDDTRDQTIAKLKSDNDNLRAAFKAANDNFQTQTDELRREIAELKRQMHAR